MDIIKIRKFLIISTIIFAILLTVLVSLIWFGKKKTSVQFQPLVTPYPTFYQKSIPTISIPSKEEEKIKISDIWMDNFYRTGRQINTNGDVVIGENNQYKILYLPLFNQFLVNILSSPFEEARKEGEEEFIKSLGITRQEACKLKVRVTTPFSINPQYAKISYPLSFCKK